MCSLIRECQEESRSALLRRERLERPAIFVGAATCGLGAGAAKTLKAVARYLDKHKIEADIVEVGCIGLCSSEPFTRRRRRRIPHGV